MLPPELELKQEFLVLELKKKNFSYGEIICLFEQRSPLGFTLRWNHVAGPHSFQRKASLYMTTNITFTVLKDEQHEFKENDVKHPSAQVHAHTRCSRLIQKEKSEIHHVTIGQPLPSFP